MLTQAPLRVLIADDEPLARARLRVLLESCRDPHAEVVAEVGTASAAQAWLREHGCDLVLLDVQMPGPDGLMLAEALQHRPGSPLVVFVTAHAKHAVEAFGLDAADYLTKPLRVERLQAALVRVAQRLREREAAAQLEPSGQDAEALSIHDRGRVVRVPLAEVLYIKAELKYLTVRTAARSYILDGSLNELEDRFGSRFLRVHRNALVARHAVRALEKHHDPEEGDGWALRLQGLDELLAVSRRQLPAVREAIGAA